jgi:hypothetical protein
MSMASDYRFAQIERWLSPPDYSTNANLARKRRHPGTGTWLLNSHAFQEWKLGSRRHLWFYGLAGCGKTILSTTILDHLLQIDTHTTLTFFFDFNDARKQKLEDLLRSLVFSFITPETKPREDLIIFSLPMIMDGGNQIRLPYQLVLTQ